MKIYQPESNTPLFVDPHIFYPKRYVFPFFGVKSTLGNELIRAGFIPEMKQPYPGKDVRGLHGQDIIDTLKKHREDCTKREVEKPKRGRPPKEKKPEAAEPTKN